MTREIELYEIPEVPERAEVLDDSLLPKYNDSFAGWNERAKATLGKLASTNGEMVGSSPLMFVRMHNAGILPNGKRLATRQDLQKAIDIYAKKYSGASFTKGIYTDFGLALRTAGDSYAPNDNLAKKLSKQLEQRGIKLGEGVLIPISALKDSEDSNEAYGLTLDLNDSTTKDTIRDLRDFKWDFQRNKGLACACRSDRDWYSVNEVLGRSYGVGRGVVVRAAGTPQKILEQKLTDYARQLAESREQYNKGLIQLKAKIDAELRSAQ